QTTPESEKAIRDLLVAAEVKSALMGLDYDIRTQAQNGLVTVKSRARLDQQSALYDEIKSTAERVAGVKEVKVEFETIYPLSE
ncbi:MAG: hypothetical protein MI892_13930, partial [Desulfobacterales bacterium]|nr:hypothetical protein [Desulfobacterales bacterium]